MQQNLKCSFSSLHNCWWEQTNFEDLLYNLPYNSLKSSLSRKQNNCNTSRQMFQQETTITVINYFISFSKTEENSKHKPFLSLKKTLLRNAIQSFPSKLS